MAGFVKLRCYLRLSLFVIHFKFFYRLITSSKLSSNVIEIYMIVCYTHLEINANPKHRF